MGGRTRLAIRWSQAARIAIVAGLTIVVLALLARALETPVPPPLPPDVGLGPLSSSPAAPPVAGEDSVGLAPLAALAPKPNKPNRPKTRQPSRPEAPEPKSKPKASPSPQLSPAPAHPPPVAPAPPPPPAAAPAPAPPPASPPPSPPQPPPPPPQTEFGFEH